MFKRKRPPAGLILIIGLFLLNLISPSLVMAQGFAGISLVPPKFELFANPGSTINESIKVTNSSDSPQTFTVYVEDFRSSGEEGQVVLEESGGEEYSLMTWITPSAESIVLQPEEQVIFPFSINVPKNAEPGGHYASLLFTIGSGEAGPGVTAVQHRVGALILLRVSGDVVEDGQIETFDIPKYSKKGPITMSLRIKNNGTTHIRPEGTIIISSIFGKKVAEIPLNGLNVFPGAVRKMDTQWDKENIFGYYTATIVSTYGQQNLPLTASSRFFVISTTALILIILGLISLAIFISSAIKGKSRILKAIKIIFTGN